MSQFVVGPKKSHLVYLLEHSIRDERSEWRDEARSALNIATVSFGGRFGKTQRILDSCVCPFGLAGPKPTWVAADIKVRRQRDLRRIWLKLYTSNPTAPALYPLIYFRFSWIQSFGNTWSLKNPTVHKCCKTLPWDNRTPLKAENKQSAAILHEFKNALDNKGRNIYFDASEHWHHLGIDTALDCGILPNIVAVASLSPNVC